MRRYIGKRMMCLALAAVLALPMTAWGRAEEPDPAEELLRFGEAVSDLIREYGLPEGEVTLAGGEEDPFASGRLVVKAEEAPDPLEALSVVSGWGELHVLQFADPAAAEAAFEIYQETEGVEYVQPDLIYTAQAQEETVALQGNEDFLSWGYYPYMYDEYDESTDEYYFGSGINMLEYQTWLLGEHNNRVSNLPEIVVAVVDTGVMADHEFLKGRMLPGYDFIENDSTPNDETGHGTHVSGTVVDGTLANVKILPVRVLNEKGWGTSLQIALGVQYAALQGADVINLSLGGVGTSYMAKEIIDNAVADGSVVVVSAGNDAMDASNQSPACFDSVICVASSDRWAEQSSFSNFGDVVDVTAPGTSIYSCLPYEAGEPAKYGFMSGTSMSAPHISAAAAMLLSAHEDYTPGEVKLHLERAAIYSIDNYYDDRETVPNLVDMACLTDDYSDGSAAVTISRAEALCCYGQKLQLSAAAAPAADIVWKSSNTSVATVNAEGLVTCGSRSGTVTISASNRKGTAKATCTVTVQPLKLTTPATLELFAGGSARVLCETNCDPAPELTWTTADSATVKLYPFTETDTRYDTTSQNGMVLHGLKVGQTTVTVGFGSTKTSFTAKVVQPGSWYDPVTLKHHIKTVSDLQAFAWAMNTELQDCFKGHTVYLDNDLSLSGVAWTPIGDFKGTFEGGNHTISGLRMEDCTGNLDALFGSLDEAGTIRDLKVEGVFSSAGSDGRKYMAGLVASNSGTIENCSFSGSVIAPNRTYVGGIAGYSNGPIIGCTANAAVEGIYYVGGIVGSQEGALSDCTSTGNVTGTSYCVGGIVGYCSGDISGCANSGDISSTGNGLGGIAGQADGTVSDCTNAGKIVGSIGYYNVGGIVGYCPGSVQNCSNTGLVAGPGDVGGIVGQILGDTKNCTNSGTVTGVSDYGDCLGGIAGYSEGTVLNCTNAGRLTGGRAYSVGGILGQGYGSIVEECENQGDVGGGTNVGGIVGSIDGEESYYGEDASSEPCMILSCYNEGDVIGSSGEYEGSYVGGIAGRQYGGATEYCSNGGLVSGRECVGGVVGYHNGRGYPVKDCNNWGSVQGEDYVGGIVGQNYSGPVYNCINSGAAEATVGYVGGVVGHSYGDVLNSLNEGFVTGGETAGGIVGYLETAAAENCVSQGAVSADTYAGSIAGETRSYSWADTKCSVTNCYTDQSAPVVGTDSGSSTVANNGVFRQLSRGSYQLTASVRAGDYTGTDLLAALNAWTLEQYNNPVEVIYGQLGWPEELVLYPAFWDGSEGYLDLVYGVGARSAPGGDYELLGVLPWDVLDYEEPCFLLARYDGAKMNSVDTLDWNEGYLLTADLPGSGDLLRLFVLTEKGVPLMKPMDSK